MKFEIKYLFVIIILLINLNFSLSFISAFGFGEGSTTAGKFGFPSEIVTTNYVINASNHSDIWDTTIGNLDNVDSTSFQNNAGTLEIVLSWFSSKFNTYFGAKTTDDLTQGSINKYDNQSWNESRYFTNASGTFAYNSSLASYYTSSQINGFSYYNSTNFTGLNLTANYFLGNGSLLTGISSVWTNSSNNATFTAGNVGIGTTSPTDRLTITGTTAGQAGQIVFGDAAGYTPYMKFYKWTGVGSDHYQNTIGNSLNAEGGLSFQTGGPGGAVVGSDTQTTRMIITQGGNVGIGTTTPTTILHLNSTSDANLQTWQDSDATCTFNPEAVASLPVCTSDESLKTNITIADTQGTLDYLLDFPLYNYNVKSSGERYMWTTAQQLNKTHPELVKEMKTTTPIMGKQNNTIMVETEEGEMVEKIIEENIVIGYLTDTKLGVQPPTMGYYIGAIQELNKKIVILQEENNKNKLCLNQAKTFEEYKGCVK